MVLVDGGILDALPVRQAKDDGMDLVIAVDVVSCLDRSCYIEDGIDAIQRAMEIMSVTLSCPSRQSADILLVPEKTSTGLIFQTTKKLSG